MFEYEFRKAHILGFLYGLGRKRGERHLEHISYGYLYIMSLGYSEAAKTCLTHLFNQSVDVYIGKLIHLIIY